MKVYLDDERPEPAGWVRARTPQEAIALLQSGQVLVISLDHDLGDDAAGNGYDVIVWMEEAVALRGFRSPRIFVHSANPAARDRMLAGVASILRRQGGSDLVAAEQREPEEQNLLTEAEIATALGVSTHWVRQATASGRLPATDRNGEMRYPALITDTRIDLRRLGDVCERLAKLPPRSVLFWFQRHAATLGGRTPVEALVDGDYSAVIEGARAFAEC